MARNLKTGWVVLATSGSVVHGAEDGRTIEKQWLEDMAETYNAKIHTARIWPDHRRYVNGGKVLALKVEPAKEAELKGEIQLYGILAPNDFLISANRHGDYTHPSIELGDNYRGTGKFFLSGLGVTDQPASCGASELLFSKQNGEEEKVTVFLGDQINVAESLEEDNSIFKRIFSRQAEQKPNTHQLQDGEDMPLSEEQMGELKSSIKSEVESAFSSLNLKPKGNNETESDDDESETVPRSEFNQVKQELDELKTQFSEALNQETPGTHTPEGTGGDATERVL
ncbi:GPO family capsid scaffolding protein [Microbulbifer sp. GL-2]|uniref:GPO family capsid scaffolding protein n=1 Tax=Microbulbifer sp. GL-2 TaxID=2591606 RepID=UPI00117E4DC6|nr:GPO family capsid scaffolding protein [Microbulbifer sp. GL-2]